ncbi:hypothetical protein [Fibrella forsythiae]|uniref:Uncharacterized protein n=1 Tax=Fibrella forsythiae TaxID=2817061 RepID=A0ABS3JNA7_9BACT|nr:hypothetical protein [Fibrella forsythiae]MBO0951486.1 hypothetical protein [Fibrella forsythiae]
MTTRLLFPHRFRLIGWIIFVPSAILGLATMYADYEISWLKFGTIDSVFGIAQNNMTNELAGIGAIIGLVLAAFSEERLEDEMINQLRLEALQWSVYANYAVLAIAMLLFYDSDFFNVMVYNMFTMLLVFIGRFRWLIYRNDQLVAA